MERTPDAPRRPPRLRPRTWILGAVVILSVVLAGVVAASRDTLRGSLASVLRQAAAAQANDFNHIATDAQVARFVMHGILVGVVGNEDYGVSRGVSFPFARPATREFVEHLAEGYREGCQGRLVVTSLTRPRSRQPRNASQRSVHPTGMAVDLRVPRDRECRAWLERNLRTFEDAGAIEATLERRPPHYHVAVFPQRFAAMLEGRAPSAVDPVPSATAALEDSILGRSETYEVRRGDNLGAIANRFGTTVRDLQARNGLSSTRIRAGQVLDVPAGR